jgi:phage terminase large subunit
MNLRPANTERVNGWAEVLQKFGDPDAGIQPALQHDPNRPEDVLKVDADEDGNGGDNCADALRYLVSTKPRILYERKLVGL